MKNYSRRPHRKTRTGCLQCRQKRIECDESKPSCRYCSRYETPCTYNTLNNSNRAVSTPSDLSAASPTIQSLLQPTLYNSDAQLQWNDLELFHHFIISTSVTCARKPGQEEMWRVAVPQLAMQHHFLMRGIFAVSALHLSHLQPNRRDELLIVAAEYQQTALQAYRSILNNVDKDNCNALFAFSALVICYAFGSPKSSEDLFLTEKDNTQAVPDWLHFLRGTYSLLSSSWESIQNGPMAPLIEPFHGRSIAPNIIDDEQLHTLIPLLESETTRNVDDQDKSKIYVAALQDLRTVFANSYSTDNSKHCVRWASFDWPVRVSEDFIRLLNDREPKALILLAHHCVLLKREEACWYLDGHAHRLLSTIEAMLAAEMRRWIEWPCKQIRC
ncbi:hypothetical protein N431DRAFT_460777 [Stipitochalara longipes BDJ]|nr:hypothetical protein N431DRAFT_460777 [Stipitochalara longipes BDJ]